MQKKRHGGSFYQSNTPPDSGEDGFTLIEVLVSVVIMTILSVVVTATFSNGTRVLSKIPIQTKENSEVILLEKTLRSFCERVVYPFWHIGIKPSQEGIDMDYYLGYDFYNLKMYYYDRRLVIKVEVNQDKLSELPDEFPDPDHLSDFEMVTKFGPFDYIDFTPMYEKIDDIEWVYGYKIKFTYSEPSNLGDQEFIVRFGGLVPWK